MSIVNILILTTAINAGARGVTSDSGRKAIRYSSKALYKTIELDKVASRLEKKYLPKVMRKYGWTAIIIKASVERKLSIEWRF